MMLSLGALAVGSVFWSLIGYSLAFGGTDPYFGSLQYAPFEAPDIIRPGTVISEHAYFVFQMAFNAITIAVISGAIVERMTLPAFCLFSILWTLVVYIPLARWIFFSGGFLARWGVLDFAGGLVVETASGVSSFVLAFWVGKGGIEPSEEPRRPHNLPYALLGAGFLYIGARAARARRRRRLARVIMLPSPLSPARSDSFSLARSLSVAQAGTASMVVPLSRRDT